MTANDTDKDDDIRGQPPVSFSPGGIEVRSTHGPDKRVCITKLQSNEMTKFSQAPPGIARWD
jgi:hypothetical protein